SCLPPSSPDARLPSSSSSSTSGHRRLPSSSSSSRRTSPLPLSFGRRRLPSSSSSGRRATPPPTPAATPLFPLAAALPSAGRGRRASVLFAGWGGTCRATSLGGVSRGVGSPPTGVPSLQIEAQGDVIPCGGANRLQPARGLSRSPDPARRRAVVVAAGVFARRSHAARGRRPELRVVAGVEDTKVGLVL
ncbi:Os09g0567100, partial [Oryza sativa Japonica Group]